MLRQKPLSLYPPSEIRQWICGFHFKSLPKVWRTIIKPGVKSIEWFCLKNMREITLFTEWKRQLSSVLSSKKKCRRFLSIVKTQCRCVTLTSLKDMEVVRCMAYLLPHQRKDHRSLSFYQYFPSQFFWDAGYI